MSLCVCVFAFGLVWSSQVLALFEVFILSCFPCPVHYCGAQLWLTQCLLSPHTPCLRVALRIFYDTAASNLPWL